MFHYFRKNSKQLFPSDVAYLACGTNIFDDIYVCTSQKIFFVIHNTHTFQRNLVICLELRDILFSMHNEYKCTYAQNGKHSNAYYHSPHASHPHIHTHQYKFIFQQTYVNNAYHNITLLLYNTHTTNG